MILKKSDRFIVMDTKTKEIISEHPFEDNKRSIELADKEAREANIRWKESK